MPRFLFLAVSFAVLTGTAVQARAQATAAPATYTPANKTESFEIVSIRPAKSLAAPHFGTTANGYEATNLSLMVTVLMAYMPLNGQNYYTSDRIKGAPDWANSERYNIAARVAEADLPRWKDPAQQQTMSRAMLQNLLADRCHLVIHRESKESATFELVTGKSAPKLKQADPAAAHPSGIALPGGGTLVRGPAGQTLTFYGATMASLAQVLSNFSGRPVLDKTGLSGSYDFMLERDNPDPDAPGPRSYAVEALGLHLDRSRSVVDTLVVDHIERPTEN